MAWTVVYYLGLRRHRKQKPQVNRLIVVEARISTMYMMNIPFGADDEAQASPSLAGLRSSRRLDSMPTDNVGIPPDSLAAVIAGTSGEAMIGGKWVASGPEGLADPRTRVVLRCFSIARSTYSNM